MTTESQQQIANNTDEISIKELILKIRDWWRYFLSKWVIIFTCGIIGGILGYYYATTKKPQFTATTTFVLEDEKSGGLGLGGLANIAGIDLGIGGGGIFQGDNIFDLYTSRKMIEKTLFTAMGTSNQSLMVKYIEVNKLMKDWETEKALQSINFGLPDSKTSTINSNPRIKRLRDSVIGVAVEDIRKNYLSVSKPDKKLSKIQVDVKSTDELFSKRFNEAIVANVNDFYLQTKTKKAAQNVAIMQHKVDSVRAVMNGAIYTAVAITDATPNLNPTRQIQRAAPAQRAQYSAEANKAVLGSLLQNLEASKLTLMKETPLLEIIDQPILPLNKTRFGKLKGLILGGILFGFLSMLYLIINKLIKVAL